MVQKLCGLESTLARHRWLIVNRLFDVNAGSAPTLTRPRSLVVNAGLLSMLTGCRLLTVTRSSLLVNARFLSRHSLVVNAGLSLLSRRECLLIDACSAETHTHSLREDNQNLSLGANAYASFLCQEVHALGVHIRAFPLTLHACAH